jgi:hypothetical protein
MQQEKHPYTFTAHDLRIGNVVNSHSAEGALLPDMVTFGHIGLLVMNPDSFNTYHSPIPITVDMLVEVGYRKSGGASITYENVKNNWLYVIAWPSGDFKFYVDGNVSLTITYLHELQNLHYDFTREMLTLKSKEK